MWPLSRRRRDYRDLVRRTAQEIFAGHGGAGWSRLYCRSRDLALPARERAFLCDVRHELEGMLGMPPQVDTATRWLSADSMFKGSQESGGR